MLDYTTCKELKDAGFPQNLKVGGGYHTHGEIPIGKKLEDTADEKVLVPTLSELIEACGRNLEALVRGRGQKLWSAVGFDDRKPVGCKIIEYEEDEPEVAVASLWLALNKK